MPAVVRAFCSVHCGEQLACAVTTALDDWRLGPARELPVRWTHPETWHLTLQFLGDWPETRLETLKKDLWAAAALDRFPLTPGTLDGFPNLNNPRVLFLQMTDDGSAKRLAGRVRDLVGECWPEGPQDTRAFRGHLTLGRVRTRLSQDESKILGDLDLGALPPVLVEGFSLVASKLGRSGPQYTELEFYPLRK